MEDMIYNIMITAAEIGGIKHKLKFIENIEKRNLKKKLMDTVYNIRYQKFSWNTITDFNYILLQYSSELLNIDTIGRYNISDINQWGFKLKFKRGDESVTTLSIDITNKMITSDYYISKDEPIFGNVFVYTTDEYCKACVMEFMSDAIKEICNILIGG